MLAALLVFLIGISMALLIPDVQFKVVDRVVDEVRNRTGQTIELEEVSINWFDRATFEGVRIYDEFDSLMIDVSRMKVNFDAFEIYRSDPWFWTK